MEKVIVTVIRKLNGSSHVFDVDFDCMEDANNFIIYCNKSNSFLSASVK